MSELRRRKRLLFYSRYAFYPPLYRVFEMVCANHDLDGFVVSHERAEIPRVYAPEGFLTASAGGMERLSGRVTVLGKGLGFGEKLSAWEQKFGEIDPDFVWAHEEPLDAFVNALLRWVYWKRRPRIVVAAVENKWVANRGVRGMYASLQRRVLWRRYDGVLGAAEKSIQSIRQYGMPSHVPARVAWLPHLEPPAVAENGSRGTGLTREPGQVVVGFAGRITREKGWGVLLEALRQLPGNFHCWFAGSGQDDEALRSGCAAAELGGRANFVGLLQKERLWAFYRALDLFALPSVSTPTWEEQFGSVLAEAMACGVPVIGSRSGAIPQVVGDAGVIVPQNDAGALAEAIYSLARDCERRAEYARKGRERFAKEFTCEAYAKKVGQALRLERV